MTILYTPEILKLATQIPHFGLLETFDAEASRTSRICGSRVSVTVCIEKGRIQKFGQDVRACALGQASAAIFGGQAIGLDSAGLAGGMNALESVLKGQEICGRHPWKALNVFLPAASYKSRHPSIRLPFEATRDALQKSTVE